MKNIYFVALIILSMLCYGCGNKNSTEVIIEHEEVEEVNVATEIDDGIADIPENERPNGHKTFDIQSFSINDYIFLYKYCYIIDNEQITVLDKQGKLIAVAASAQQVASFNNFIRYIYDKNGNHIGFARIWNTYYPEQMETFNKPYEGCDYFDYLYYDVCVRNYDDPELIRYMFRYDDDGLLKEVYDPIHELSLKAPDGAHIRWRIEECARFWESDLAGGKYYLMFYVMPIGENFYRNSLCYDVYEGYKPYDYEGDDGQY